MQIIPAILEKKFEVAEEKVRLVKGLSKWIQVDVVDGKFDFGKTFELELLTTMETETESTLWDIHLMVEEPKNWIGKCNFVGAMRVTGQVEKMVNKDDFVNSVKDFGLEAGLAFDIDTEIKDIPQETDLVLLLGRKAGFESKPMDKKIYQRIEELKKIKEGGDFRFLIGIDGGVNETNIKKIKESGVDIVYCTGAIFNGKVEDNLEKLKYASEN